MRSHPTWKVWTIGSAISWAALAAGAQPPPYDGIFDWPVGARNATGLSYLVQQNYDNLDGPRLCNQATCATDDDYTYTCGRGHAGLDLTLPTAANASGAAVYSAADGIVECTANPNYPGSVVVVRHPLPDGGVIYTQYGHLGSVAAGLVAGTVLRRGAPIGTIYNWGNNSHLHFEVRTFPRWDRALDQPSFDPTKECFGRGYAAPNPLGVELDPGYLDTVGWMLSHRTFPVTMTAPASRLLLTEPSTAGTPVVGAPQIPANAPFVVLQALRDRNFVCGTTDPAGESECFAGVQHCRPDRYSLCDSRKVPDCTTGACDWWYKVRYTPAGSTTSYTGYFRALTKGGYGSDLGVGEPFVAAAPWTDPAGTPLVWHEYDINDVLNRAVANRGSDSTLGGQIAGSYQITAPPAESSIVLDGTTSYVEVTNSGRIKGPGAFQVEARVTRASATGEDIVAGQWHPTDPARQRWLLTLLPANAALARHAPELRFQAKTSDGVVRMLSYALPECPDPFRPFFVGASFDPAVGFKLYYQRRLVVSEAAAGLQMAAGNVTLRIGSDGRDAVSDAARFHGQIDRFRFWAPTLPACSNLDLAFVVDTTGSMGDDIAQVKAAASDIVDRLLSGPACARFAVTDYRDFPVAPYGAAGDYPYKADRDFTNNRAAVLAAIQALSIGNGNDFPESVYSGIVHTIQTDPDGFGGDLSPWRSNAAKAILLFGDAPAHDPEPISGYTLGSVIQAALAGGVITLPGGTGLAAQATSTTTSPIEISAIHIGFDASTQTNFRALADRSGGTYFSAPAATDVVDAVIGAIDLALSRLPVANPDFEVQTFPQYGRMDGWGPSGAWQAHATSPQPGSANLGARFGFYAAGTTETVGQVLEARFAPTTTYTFKSHALGGGDLSGRVPYQIGYTTTEGNLSTFVALKTQVIDVTGWTTWAPTAGVSYTTGATGTEIGKKIAIRFGNASAGGYTDIWFDDVQVIAGRSEPPPPPPGALLANGDIEVTTTPSAGRINGWGPNGAWAFHNLNPIPGNTGLGSRFGYYAAGTAETFGQVLALRIAPGKTYTFGSWAYGGVDRLGKIPYQIGYAAVDGDLSSFVALKTTIVSVDGETSWVAKAGVSYTSPVSGAGNGKQLIVRFGNAAAGGVSDIWFDNLTLDVTP